jgi:hypothetical protein
MVERNEEVSIQTRALSVLIAAMLPLILAGSRPLGALGEADRLDGGLLDPQWLGVTGGAEEWRRSEKIDYLWVKPGFSIEGKTLSVEPWSAPVFLNSERDNADSKLALLLTETMPGRLESAFSAAGVTGVSRSGGDILVTGRIVDCNAGSTFLRLMSGSGVLVGNATWDIKLVDAATGETLAAVHHRGVSGGDSRNLGEKVNRWLTRVFAPALHDSFAVSRPEEEGDRMSAPAPDHP